MTTVLMFCVQLRFHIKNSLNDNSSVVLCTTSISHKKSSNDNSSAVLCTTSISHKKLKKDSSNDNSFTFCVQLQFHIKNRKHQKHTARFARNEFSKTGFF